MAIKVECPECGKGFSAQDSYRGKKIQCPGCGRVIAALTLTEARDAAVIRARDESAHEAAEKKRVQEMKGRLKKQEEQQREYLENKARERREAKKHLKSLPDCPNCGSNIDVENVYAREKQSFFIRTALNTIVILLIAIFGVLCAATPVKTYDYSWNGWKTRVTEGASEVSLVFWGIFVFLGFIIIVIIQALRIATARNSYICIKCGSEFVKK